MVNDGDNQRGEGSSLGEKRSFDLQARLLHAFGDEKTRARRGKEEQERNIFMIDTITSAAAKFFFGHNKCEIDKCENQQNPDYRYNYASSSSSTLSSIEPKRRRWVSDKTIRAEPIREIKPPVRRKGPVKRKSVRIESGMTPNWVVDLMTEKNGVDAAKLIIEKEITASDLRKNQGRLLMPFNQMVNMNFLTEAELNIMKKFVGKSRKQGVDVILVDSDGREWKLNLRTWGMNSSSNYVLCTGWHKVVLSHELKEGQTIRLWSFHSQDGNLYFAFLSLPPAPAPVSAPAPGMPQPQAKDPAQAVALPQAQDPDQIMPLALAPAIATATASSSSMTSDEDIVALRTSDFFLRCLYDH